MAANGNGGPPPEYKSASRRSTRFKEENEYLEVTLDVRGDGDAVAIHSVKDGGGVEMSEATLLPPTPGPGGLSSRLKAELRRIVSMTKPPPVVAQQQRPRLDRSMTGARQALRGLQFLNQSVVTQGSWPEVEKRFDRLAAPSSTAAARPGGRPRRPRPRRRGLSSPRLRTPWHRGVVGQGPRYREDEDAAPLLRRYAAPAPLQMYGHAAPGATPRRTQIQSKIQSSSTQIRRRIAQTDLAGA